MIGAIVTHIGRGEPFIMPIVILVIAGIIAFLTQKEVAVEKLSGGNKIK